jgi:hypothetical protein
VGLTGERILIDGKERQLTPEQKQILRKITLPKKARSQMQNISEKLAKAAEMKSTLNRLKVRKAD